MSCAREGYKRALDMHWADTHEHTLVSGAHRLRPLFGPTGLRELWLRRPRQAPAALA